MEPTIPQDIAVGLPFVAAMIAHYLTSDNLAPWKNALIAALFIVATAGLCIWLSGSFIPGDPQASVLLVVAYVTLLMRGPLSMLASFFASVPSPFDPAPPTSMQSVVSKAYIPAGSSTPTVVPSRSSAQPPQPPIA
jgi:hypothetical protein